MISAIVQDIIDDPGAYWPMLLFLSALLLFWSGLCLSGWVSLRAATRRRRLWFAFAPLVFGLIGVWSRMPFSLEGDGHQLSFDLRWMFIVPLFLGIAGLISCWKVKHEPGGQLMRLARDEKLD